MAYEVFLPKLGLTMDEGTIISWLKQEGDEVAEGQPLFEVETDKVVMETEAPASGILGKILVENGTTVPVGEVIAVITQAGEAVPEKYLVAQAAPPVPAPTPAVQPAQRPEAVRPAPTGEIAASPAARRLAREHGIELATIVGSGPGGRIVERDVEQAIQARAVPVGQAPSPVLAATPAGEIVPLSGIRKKTAERMAQSFQTVPHFYLTVEVRADRLTEVRKSLLPQVEAEVGARLSFTDLLVKCLALTLKSHPMANAAWHDGAIRLNPEINIGIAVATKDGLVVPIIRNADALPISQIAGQRAELEAQAKEKRLSLDAVSGGTFTLTNLGAFGIDVFSPIINPPQAAILAVGRIAERPVSAPAEAPGQAARLVSCPTMFLTLAVDHRTMDGADAAAFLSELRDLIERLAPADVKGS